jgi:hypothetical protein
MRKRPGLWSLVAALATFAFFATTLAGTASGASSGRPAANAGPLSSTTNIPLAGSMYGATASVSPLGGWTAATPYPINIVRYAFAQVGESLYVIGGVSDGTRVADVNRYDAATNTWTPRAALAVATEAPSGAYLNGKIYVADGDLDNVLRIYDIASNSWSTGGSRIGVSNGYGAAAGAYNGKVFFVGGSTSGPLDVTSIYDVATNSWSLGPPAPSPYLLGGYQQVGQYLYVIGSFGSSSASNSNVSMRLDMATSTWTTGPTWTPARADFGLATTGSKIFAMGGDINGGGYFEPSTQVDELDITTWPAGAWVASPPNLPGERQANQAGFFSTAHAGGEIWSTGGLDANFTFLPDHLFRTEALPPPPPPTPPPPPPPPPGVV